MLSITSGCFATLAKDGGEIKKIALDDKSLAGPSAKCMAW